MTDFKPGDRVRRIKEGWAGLEVGDEGVVEAVTKHALHLEGRATGFIPSMFELVEPVTPEFKVGDRVRRKAENVNNDSYTIGTHPFVITGIRSGYFLDQQGRSHHKESLEFAPEEQPEEALPTIWTLTVEIESEDLAYAVDVAASLPLDFSPDSFPDDVVSYKLETTLPDGRRRGVGYTR